jgi:hypothetical protein
MYFGTYPSSMNSHVCLGHTRIGMSMNSGFAAVILQQSGLEQLRYCIVSDTITQAPRW